MGKILTFIKTRKILSAIIAIAAISLAGYILTSKNSGPSYNTATAKRGTVTQEVSVTGNVKAAQSADLAFQNSGVMAHIYVAVGDRIAAGQQLASLVNDDIQAQLLQAKAGQENAQATLDELRKGAQPEDIAVSQADLDKSKQDLNNYYSGALNILNDSYTKASDAVKNQTSAMFSNPESDNPTLTFTANDSQAQINVQFQRTLSRDALVAWKNELDSLNAKPTQALTDTALVNADKHIATVSSFLNLMNSILQNTGGTSATTINSYKTSVNTGLVEVNLAATNIGNQEQLIASQKITVEKNQSALALKIAGATVEQIAAQQAAVNQAQANVANYQAQLEKTILRSPLNGIVTKQNGTVGEITPANTPVISVISNARFQIEAYIPEADIAKITTGDTATVTLDAFGSGVIFHAKVIMIDIGETMTQGIATYKTTFEFVDATDAVKPGMTANLDILAAQKDNAIYVPQRAITTNGGKTVEILQSGKTVKKTAVEAGLRGSDGNVEIISGVNEGDLVIIPQ